MKARYYDERIGRFLSNDPVGFRSSRPVSFNRYTYSANNPYRYIDPDGSVPIVVVKLIISPIKLAKHMV